MKKQTKKVTLTSYISDDGLLFKSEQECLAHEQRRRDSEILSKLIVRNIDFPDIIDGLMYPACYMVCNEEERDAIFRNWCTSGRYSFVNDKERNAVPEDIEIGDWVYKRYRNDDDGTEQLGVYTLRYLLKTLSDFTNDINLQTVGGKF